jgi:hypothetical protein
LAHGFQVALAGVTVTVVVTLFTVNVVISSSLERTLAQTATVRSASRARSDVRERTLFRSSRTNVPRAGVVIVTVRVVIALVHGSAVPVVTVVTPNGTVIVS